MAEVEAGGERRDISGGAVTILLAEPVMPAHKTTPQHPKPPSIGFTLLMPLRTHYHNTLATHVMIRCDVMIFTEGR